MLLLFFSLCYFSSPWTLLRLKVKLNADESHAKDKSRLAAKGLMTKIGLDSGFKFYSAF
jgi:hypothetical protein